MEGQNEQSDLKIPEGAVLTEDGCICPPKVEKKKVCKKGGNTCPYDPRFPNTDQTRHCYFSFVDYQRCARLLGDYPGCTIFLKCWTTLCPYAWTDKWYEQMENGTFPRKIYPCKPIIYRNSSNICDDTEDDEVKEPEEPVC